MVYTSRIPEVYTMTSLENISIRAIRKTLAAQIAKGKPLLIQSHTNNVALLVPLKPHSRYNEKDKAKETARIKSIARRGDLALT